MKISKITSARGMVFHQIHNHVYLITCNQIRGDVFWVVYTYFYDHIITQFGILIDGQICAHIHENLEN